MEQKVEKRRARLTTPRAAAVAGILFSILLVISIVLIRISIPDQPHDTGSWIFENGKTVVLALNLVPFAGIAFLWFIGVVRDRIGEHEDRFFATVFLGSGLLFLAMLFVTAATAGGLIEIYLTGSGNPFDLSIYRFGRSLTLQMMNVYTIKMAGVFMISTCTLAHRTGIFPRWMAYLGIALALVLLFSVGFTFWAIILFPLWVLLISVHILLANLGKSEGEIRPAA
jgi:hypothetical protein